METQEKWVSVKNSNGLYEISDLGNFRSTNQKSSKTNFGKNGYEYFNMWVGGKNKRGTIHRLVALHFIPNPENKPQVNHKDGNKKNNCASNLEWTTLSENMRHAFDTGIMDNSRKKAAERMRQLGYLHGRENAKSLEKTRRRTKVFKYDSSGVLLEEYESFKSLYKQTGTNQRTVMNCIKDNRMYKGKYIWKIEVQPIGAKYHPAAQRKPLLAPTTNANERMGH
jgi:hypothetical protein